MDNLAKTFFGVDLQQLATGSLQLDLSLIWFLFFVLVLIIVFAFGYLKLAGSAASAVARIALICLIAFVLLRPTLNTQSEQTVDGETLVLIDNSLSMNIADNNETSRAQTIRELLDTDQAFGSERVRLIAVGNTAVEIDTIDELKFDASRSDLTNALSDVVAGKLGNDTASVVLLTDGGDSSKIEANSVLRQLKASGIAVNVVGLGADRFDSDIEISDVRLSRRVIAGDTIEAEVVIRQSGYNGKSVTLNVERDGSLLTSQSVKFGSDESYTVTLPVELKEPGQYPLNFTIDPLANELLNQNNTVTTTILADDAPLDVLHFEGEPRFEVKFLRRALFDESFIRLRSLIRTAENKYYRVGVVDANELEDGFPETEKELFQYDVLVVGSANSELLGEREQTLIRDFVARRGGGLLLLGSANSFAEGGFRDSILADIMPVALTNKATSYRSLAKVRPAPDQSSSLIRLPETTWESLPELTIVNPVRTAKPGATVVLEGHVENEEPLIVLATHRYGRGKVATLTVRNTWRWQMHADVGPEDTTHETLMRQITRWLGRDVPGQTEMEISQTKVAQGEAVAVSIRAVSETFQPLTSRDALPGRRLEVTTPSGQILLPEFVASTDTRDSGETSFIANEAGRYDLRVVGEDETVVSSDQIEVFATGQEFFQAQRDSDFLGAIAEKTGGRYLTANQLESLPDAIKTTRRVELRQERIELWKTPFMLCLLLGLAIIDWLLRKRGSLA